MAKIQKLINYLMHPSQLIIREKLIKLDKNKMRFSDRELIERIYKLNFGKDINLDNPVTFNEKLNWRKLYDRNPLYTKMVDKYESKLIVQKLVGEQYVAKLYGIYNSFDEIDFDKLPDKFVLKTTHDCGGVVIVKDKNTLDKIKVKKNFDQRQKNNYFYSCREWPYKDVPPRILAEEYLEFPGADKLYVYKIFCFSGEPKLFQVIQNDKLPNESIDYFDTEWNLLDLRQNFPNSKNHLPKPENLEEMLSLAKKLSQDIPFVRVDLYVTTKGIKFSEFTFFSDAGFCRFYPEKWDNVLGDYIKINK